MKPVVNIPGQLQTDTVYFAQILDTGAAHALQPAKVAEQFAPFLRANAGYAFQS